MSVHALSRALDQLSHGAALQRDSNRGLLLVDQLQEMIHQFQIPVSGTAQAIPSWTTVTIPFDVEFVDATEQRDSPYIVPNFTFGAVLDVPVIICAVVTTWVKATGRTSISGANVAIGAIGAGEVFTGAVHMTFQGYGATSLDNASALDVGT